MTTLATYLEDIVNNESFPQSTRVLAAQALQQWNRNVIPNPNLLKKISKLIQPLPPCARPAHDGTCAWLRKHGEGNQLSVPPIGEKAVCCFKGTVSQCPGYKKMRSTAK